MRKKECFLRLKEEKAEKSGLGCAEGGKKVKSIKKKSSFLKQNYKFLFSFC